MPAIASINAQVAGVFIAAPTVMTAADTITFDPRRRQLAVFRNPTGSAINALIDGNGGTTVSVPGLPPIDVSGGLTVNIPANSTRAVVLATISAYCQGTVNITGGTGAELTVYDL